MLFKFKGASSVPLYIPFGYAGLTWFPDVSGSPLVTLNVAGAFFWDTG